MPNALDEAHQPIGQSKRLLAAIRNSQFQQEISPSHHPEANAPITFDLFINRRQRIRVHLDHIVEETYGQAHHTLKRRPIDSITMSVTIRIGEITRMSEF